MKKQLFLFCTSFVFFLASCEKKETQVSTNDNKRTVKEVYEVDRVEPPNWWVGFENSQVQLLIKHPNIGKAELTIEYPGVVIEKLHKAKSPNYLFVDLNISNKTKPGTFDLIFKLENGEEKIHTYELKAREKEADKYVGFNSSDVIYLITPDRYVNGNPNNDIFEDLNEKKINRKDDYARHGGDITGITNHLDYIADMGFTAIWSSPLLINDMKQGSYHGYAMTDYYKVDPRFGTLDEYRKLADEGRKRGIKLIMDQVANHCGLYHWWMKDLPFEDWLNYQKNYEDNIEDWNWKKTKFSNHRRTANQDVYASEIDKEGLTDGWFVEAMPDLNQRNPYMATYIIQNSIWWIETLGLGGIRQDTYPYPDKEFMAKWAGAIMKEYPNFNIVGEEWSYNPLLIGYWQQGKVNKDGYNSNLRSSMDFAMQSLVVQALNEEESWDKGLVKIYEGLANDFAYYNPKDIMVFPDNHDMSRIFTQLKGDVHKTKMALSYYLMMPRTPQIYYGTEILMDDFKKPGDHGLIRTDFPGGWDGDAVNAFTGKGLTAAQKDMQMFLKKLLNYRKSSKAMHDGKTIHFAPRGGLYVLFRMYEDEVVAIILNKSDRTSVSTEMMKEIGIKGKKVKNIITDEEMIWEGELKINPKGVTLLTTKRN
ncbi:glycoside hydrolase family 13 protein [Flavobacteriaceae bacterium S356]|uniref:Glycoside hydrolase family 13 protein n=1 Tax=Asprobacillus argus TaxID=3076534 RepID=A0ABU3LD00_9FLAO|nr:glycoside hydrolase family 13 protein [Flavobacteriaceae bacterium S356]